MVRVMLEWADVAEIFEFDGSLLDIYVLGTTADDWQRLLDLVRTQTWWFEYSADRSVSSLPEDVHVVFRQTQEASCLLHIQPAPGLHVHAHFFTADEIEFDIDPREIGGQGQLDVLCTFLRTVGTQVGKPIVLTSENGADIPYVTYTPAEDQFTLHVEALRSHSRE
jgi:hypothetical protein